MQVAGNSLGVVPVGEPAKGCLPRSLQGREPRFEARPGHLLHETEVGDHVIYHLWTADRPVTWDDSLGTQSPQSLQRMKRAGHGARHHEGRTLMEYDVS